MTIKLDGNSVAEQVVAGTVLLAVGAAGAIAYEKRHAVKHHVKKLKSKFKKTRR